MTVSSLAKKIVGVNNIVAENADLETTDFKKQMEDLLNDQSVRVYVCENRGKKTGMMVLKVSDSGAEIIGIVMSEKLRRRGIGRHLILLGILIRF